MWTTRAYRSVWLTIKRLGSATARVTYTLILAVMLVILNRLYINVIKDNTLTLDVEMHHFCIFFS